MEEYLAEVQKVCEELYANFSVLSSEESDGVTGGESEKPKLQQWRIGLEGQPFHCLCLSSEQKGVAGST